MAGSTPIFGFPYPESSDLVANYPALGQDLAEDIESVLSAGFGKVLQVVRATDTTLRTTTSSTYIDASISVTITPQKSTSAILLIWSADVDHSTTSDVAKFQITDNSNNAISGAQDTLVGSGTTTQFFTGLVRIAESHTQRLRLLLLLPIKEDLALKRQVLHDY